MRLMLFSCFAVVSKFHIENILAWSLYSVGLDSLHGRSNRFEIIWYSNRPVPGNHRVIPTIIKILWAVEKGEQGLVCKLELESSNW